MAFEERIDGMLLGRLSALIAILPNRLPIVTIGSVPPRELFACFAAPQRQDSPAIRSE